MRYAIPHRKIGEWRVGPVWAGESEPATGLFWRESIYMVDIPPEIDTQRLAVEAAKERGGDVLVTGLGLGIIADMILELPNVNSVTVVELNREVIELVAPTLWELHPERLNIVLGNAFLWEPPKGMHYTVGWHDFWHYPSCRRSQNRVEAEWILERYRPWCDWQGIWTGDEAPEFYR